MGDKCRRVSELCVWLAEHARLADDSEAILGITSEDAARAGLLSKADLVSAMVGEFDTLQGIMGGIYARRKGECKAVADALAEQYLPAGPDSPVPASLLGALLSMADKADTLVGCFGLGMIPTGAADPYALRRAALGIARIMLEKGLLVDIDALFDKARELYGERHWKLSAEEARAKLHEFFVARVKNLFLSRGHDTLFVEAVAATGASQVWSTARRLKALEAFGQTEGFLPSVQTFKRVGNILRKQGGSETLTGSYDAALFDSDAEKALAAHLEQVFADFDDLHKAADFDTLLIRLSELRPSVDTFFNNVMVICDDPDVRHNRLNLLKAIMLRLDRLADFSALQL